MCRLLCGLRSNGQRACSAGWSFTSRIPAMDVPVGPRSCTDPAQARLVAQSQRSRWAGIWRRLIMFENRYAASSRGPEGEGRQRARSLSCMLSSFRRCFSPFHGAIVAPPRLGSACSTIRARRESSPAKGYPRACSWSGASQGRIEVRLPSRFTPIARAKFRRCADARVIADRTRQVLVCRLFVPRLT